MALARGLLWRNRGKVNVPDYQETLALTDTDTLPAGLHRDINPYTMQDVIILHAYTLLAYAHQPERALHDLAPLRHLPYSPRKSEALYWSSLCARQIHDIADKTSSPAGQESSEESATSLMNAAADLPTTFYGQEALAYLTRSSLLSNTARNQAFLSALHQKLATLPVLQAGSLPRPDLLEAATLLVKQGDRDNASLFLTQLLLNTKTSSGFVALAQTGNRFGIPKIGIMASRALATKGKILYPAGYSLPYTDFKNNLVSSLPAGLLPALVRQESNGDPAALSPAHALGLTQVLPLTAHRVARKHHLPLPRNISEETILNPQINLLLGGLYLQDLWQQYNDSVPLTLIAYNAGPGRADAWQKALDSFSAPSPHGQSAVEQEEAKSLNWLMLLPYTETRTYIAHIIADMNLYAILRH